MANRTWLHARTQGIEHVYLPVTLLSAGTGTPTLSEGDPNGSYYSIVRNSLGNYTLTTKDSFLAIVYKAVVAPSGYRASLGIASQNASGTWNIPFYICTDAGSIASITVSAAGSGYTSVPTIAYNNAHGNTGFVGTPVLSAGTVASVTVNSGGLGTDGTPPTLTISGGGGSGATATAVMGGSAADVLTGRPIRFLGVFRNSSVTP